MVIWIIIHPLCVHVSIVSVETQSDGNISKQHKQVSWTSLVPSLRIISYVMEICVKHLVLTLVYIKSNRYYILQVVKLTLNKVKDRLRIFILFLKRPTQSKLNNVH